VQKVFSNRNTRDKRRNSSYSRELQKTPRLYPKFTPILYLSTILFNILLIVSLSKISCEPFFVHSRKIIHALTFYFLRETIVSVRQHRQSCAYSSSNTIYVIRLISSLFNLDRNLLRNFFFPRAKHTHGMTDSAIN